MSSYPCSEETARESQVMSLCPQSTSKAGFRCAYRGKTRLAKRVLWMSKEGLMRRERGRKTNYTFLSRNIGPVSKLHVSFSLQSRKILAGVGGWPQGLLSGCSPWPGKSLWKRPKMKNPSMPGATSLLREKYVSYTSY